jgi:hypothetical protein
MRMTEGIEMHWMALVFSIVCATVPAAGEGHIPQTNDPELKAAFLLNFAKFTVWPPEMLPPDSPLIACVLGGGRVAEALEDLTRGQQVQGREVIVRRIDADGPIRTCHLLYGTALEGPRAAAVVGKVASAPVLTVSDSADFASRGGIANFYVDAGRMRFAVNPEAATRAGLRLSSRLLNLARLVKEDHDGGGR